MLCFKLRCNCESVGRRGHIAASGVCQTVVPWRLFGPALVLRGHDASPPNAHVGIDSGASVPHRRGHRQYVGAHFHTDTACRLSSSCSRPRGTFRKSHPTTPAARNSPSYTWWPNRPNETTRNSLSSSIGVDVARNGPRWCVRMDKAQFKTYHTSGPWGRVSCKRVRMS